MKAFLFSIGEPTAELSEWSLERQGFDVTVVYNPDTSLSSKLKWLYNHVDEDFIRVDADVICNLNLMKLEPHDNCWWHCAYGWDWNKMDIGSISVHWVKQEALPYLRKGILRFENAERPETELSRIEEFMNPRRYETYNVMCGIHGWGQRDINRVKETKLRRGQEDYDFELVEKLNAA